MEPADRAQAFRDLHRGPRILVLPNVWDAASARVFETAGFPAVATTSAGIAYSLGYPDGERLALDDLLATVSRLTRAVSIPVSVDFESGFGRSPKEVSESCRLLLETGAVGINLEDGRKGDEGPPLEEPSLHAEKIRAAREAADAASVPLFVNARTDVFLSAVGPPGRRLDEALRRAAVYFEAGADGLFVPGPKDLETIEALVRSATGPLNVLAVEGSLPVGELEQLGVRRVTVGSGPMRATMGLVRRIAEELERSGTYSSFLDGAIPYNEANALFREH